MKRIKSSSIAEVVIAMSIIALCIGVSSLIFVRSTKSTVNFQDVRKQTEIQSKMWEQFYTDSSIVFEIEGVVKKTTKEDSLWIQVYINDEGDELWTQQWVKE